MKQIYMLKRTSVLFRSLFVGAFVLLAIACNCLDQKFEISQSFEDGTLIESVNGKKLTCKVDNKASDTSEIVFICTNETDFDASIDVFINDEKVETITKFPAESRYATPESGIYKLSISGTLKSRGSLSKVFTEFSYTWSISVE